MPPLFFFSKPALARALEKDFIEPASSPFASANSR